MNTATPVFRFAPSPNGELHLGHAYSAIVNMQMARAVNGKILLRIEDIDTARCTPELEAQMLRDLEWIGFEWDEEPCRQSERFDQYREALLQLDRCKLIYSSNLSRSAIGKRVQELEASGTSWPRDPDGAPLYPGTEREVTARMREPIEAALGQKVIRLDTNQAIQKISPVLKWTEFDGKSAHETREILADPAAWGDVVLARRDTPTSYHLACTLDDANQSITHVVRGKDLFHATSIHRLLQELLELPVPKYFHHQLFRDEKLRKLSKSKKATSLRQLREAGNSRQDVLRLIGLYNET